MDKGGRTGPEFGIEPEIAVLPLPATGALSTDPLPGILATTFPAFPLGSLLSASCSF